MKMCASCRHPEIDHEGLSCRGLGNWGCGCWCRGFEDPDEPEVGFAPAPVDAELLATPFLPGWPDDPKIPFEFGEARLPRP